jgi:Domain of unknown function (DUF4265)
MDHEGQMDTRKTIKVILHLDPDSWHGTSTEGIWTRLVQPLGDKTNVKAIVEVDNIPFHSKSVSLGDKLCLDFNSGIPMIDAIVERGGHSTYRIVVEKENSNASSLLDTIKAMGCDWEWAEFNEGKLYALDIPPEVDIDDVYKILEKGLREGSWLFEEGYVGHPAEGDQSTPNSPGH